MAIVTGAPIIPITPAIFPILLISVPMITKAGPATAATAAIFNAICCTCGLAFANASTISVAFCTSGVNVGSKCCPSAIFRLSTAPWKVLKLFAVPSEVLA